MRALSLAGSGEADEGQRRPCASRHLDPAWHPLPQDAQGYEDDRVRERRGPRAGPKRSNAPKCRGEEDGIRGHGYGRIEDGEDLAQYRSEAEENRRRLDKEIPSSTHEARRGHDAAEEEIADRDSLKSARGHPAAKALLEGSVFMGDALRVILDDGSADPRTDPHLVEAEALRLHRGMLLERILDNRMLALQRQGRIGFYGPSVGQEAAIVAPAIAMNPEDWIVPQYREPGAALARGMPLVDLVAQFIGNSADPILGHQMPCHYVYRKGNYLSISSPVGTQIPHAVGVAWAMKIRGDRAATLVYFGDGATSTSDFHVAMNFAGVVRAPVVLLCNNNQWAISIPVSRQTAVSTLAEKALAYGFEGVRVDGNDALAVYAATKAAADKARAGGGPTMIEAVTYRMGPHSSSDDPTRYRDEREVAAWRARDPLEIFRRFLHRQGWWDDEKEARLEQELGDAITAAVAEAEKALPLARETLFEQVYADLPWNLVEQRAEGEGG